MTTSKNIMHSNDTSKDIFQKRVNLWGNIACAGYIYPYEKYSCCTYTWNMGCFFMSFSRKIMKPAVKAARIKARLRNCLNGLGILCLGWTAKNCLTAALKSSCNDDNLQLCLHQSVLNKLTILLYGNLCAYHRQSHIIFEVVEWNVFTLLYV